MARWGNDGATAARPNGAQLHSAKPHAPGTSAWSNAEERMTAAHGLPTDADTQAYARDGAVPLRGFFKEWVEPLRAGVEKLMAAPSPRERSYVPEDGSAPFFQDLCNWQRLDEFTRFVHDSAA